MYKFCLYINKKLLGSDLMRAIITVIGKDKKGIISKTSTCLAESEINILDINQTILQDFFTMIMLVDLADMKISFEQLVSNMDELSSSLNVSIKVQHEDIFNSMHEL
jgi:ACT domain-containing protein